MATWSPSSKPVITMSDSNKPNSHDLDTRTIRVSALARVEGEGALHLQMENGKLKEVRLEIYEPPRFFEAFLRGRSYQEVPDITARICGICPVAYQMGACHALEKALGADAEVTPAIESLRDLLYCGEWIESHVLHMFMLHLPDFLGYESAISMAEQHEPVVRRALRIKKAGNELVALLGGRAVHPVGVCVGGFYRAPSQSEALALVPEIEACLEDMCDLTLLLCDLVTLPDLEQDYEFVALCPDDHYPMNRGRIKSNKGLDIAQEEFLDAIEEIHVAHSTGATCPNPAPRFLPGRSAGTPQPLLGQAAPASRPTARNGDAEDRTSAPVAEQLPQPFRSRHRDDARTRTCPRTVDALSTAASLASFHRAPSWDWRTRDRGTAGDLLASIRNEFRREDQVGTHCSTHEPESKHH